MPTTINGIGTHYYGKKNLQVLPGTCRSCGRAGNLSSYDTRLWFVVVFIPIIPLGQKRILDACPSCRRHYVMDLEKWETTKQLETSGAVEKFRSDPTPENAIAAHQQMLTFHQMKDAMEFQEKLKYQFHDNAKVQIYLAQAMDHVGKNTEAAPFYNRAFELRPDMPEARVGVARLRMREKKLDDARGLLDFLEKPGAAQLYSLYPLEQLGDAYLAAGRHKEMLEIAGEILREVPTAGQNKKFRKSVTTSEKALGLNTTILPKKKFSWKGLFESSGAPAGPRKSVPPKVILLIVGVVALLFLVCFLMAASYSKGHRTLFLVNGLKEQVQLVIDGNRKVNLRPGTNSIEIKEGTHTAKMLGPIPADIPFEIKSGAFDRMVGHQAWVLNPDSSALLLVQNAVYAKNPRPGSYYYSYGKSFYAFNPMTHPFTALPTTVRVDSGSSTKELTHVELFRGTAADAFVNLKRAKRSEEAFNLIEWAIVQNPLDEKLLQEYVATATTNDIPRLLNFFKAGLARRPVAIEWHRYYQSLLLGKPEAISLIKEYDAYLAADPTNSALLYLRGRLDGNHATGTEYFERAHAADGSNPYPIYALGIDRELNADWAEAAKLLEAAVALRPENEQFFEQWKVAMLAKGDYSTLDKKLRARLQANLISWEDTADLCEVLAVEGAKAEAKQVMDRFVAEVKGQYPDSSQDAEKAARQRLLYLTGELSAVEKISSNDRTPLGRMQLFYILVDEGKPEAAERVAKPAEITDITALTAMSLAWRASAQTDRALPWEKRLVSVLEKGGGDSQRTIRLIQQKTEPMGEALEITDFGIPFKAVLLADLSLIYPSHRAELAAEAMKLNVSRAFPYYLIKQNCEGTR